MAPLEMPPATHGTPEERIAALEKYLMRLIMQLNEERKNA